ncbi:PilZ domain-containing protein [Hyphomonas sp.]|uniref:PilZ domain-containing protein n=1 Tax=Hyphomonas sp. TaxID=87 RepID=UPI003437E511|nr:PilZ domain-containing protein [Hyphomonas sp.]
MPKSLPSAKVESEYRQHARRRMLKSGRIIFNNSRSSLDVQITDLSASGARLKMSIPMPCPALFNLEFLHPAVGSPAIRRCALRWQRGETCGVVFI